MINHTDDIDAIDSSINDDGAHRNQLLREGYTILESVIEDHIVDALLDDVARLESELSSAPADNRFEGARTTRTYNLLARSAVWQQVPVRTEVLTLIEAVLGPQPLISSLASISLAPGESPQVIHTDDQIFPIAKPHVPLVCNAMWALTDFTEKNGATRVVPGSHLWGDPNYFETDTSIQSIAAEMPKGSVLVWQGSTWHGGGANVSDEVRIGVAMNYCAGFIRQQENQMLGIPTDTLGSFSPQLRQLCGLGMYRGLTGNIEKQSPAALLFGDDPEVQLWDAEPIEGATASASATAGTSK